MFRGSRSFYRQVALLAVCAIGCLITGAGASDDLPFNLPSRHLSQFRDEPSFPWSRCDTRAQQQPYYLIGPNVTYDLETSAATYTFVIGYKGPRGDASPCYTALEESLHKVMISAYSECQAAVQLYDNYATINGKQTPLYVYPKPQGMVISITSLKLNAESAHGSVISFSAAPPCNRPAFLFNPEEEKGVFIAVAFSESSQHKCCGLNY